MSLLPVLVLVGNLSFATSEHPETTLIFIEFISAFISYFNNHIEYENQALITDRRSGNFKDLSLITVTHIKKNNKNPLDFALYSVFHKLLSYS